MNKKNFVIVFVLIILCLSVQAAKWQNAERGNDKAHIDAARHISSIEGVKWAAVLSCDGRVLAGITLLPGADKGYVGEWAEEFLKTDFADAKKIRIFTGDENARDVAELSFCIETDMNRKLLKKRFDFLVEQKI